MRSSDHLESLEAALDGIGHILRDLRLTVPVYQRSYSWEDEQVQAFWDDLRAAMLAGEPVYFMGTVVLSGTPRSRDRTIIDGQQRLATASILLAAIRDAFEAAGEAEKADVIQHDYLTHRSLESSGAQPRLRLNTQDAEYFNRSVLGIGLPEHAERPFASNERIERAYVLLKENLQEEVDAARSAWASHLLRWVEFLEEGVQIIVVRVLNDTDAFLVFETLNDRGLALTVADLLKNYLFGQARDDIAEVEEPWLMAASTLETPEGSQRFLDFLRQYWSSWYGATRERELYESLRRNVRSAQQAILAAQRFRTGSTHYLALVSGDVAQWPSSEIDAATVETLQRLRLSQHRPLLLAAMEHLDEPAWVHLVRCVICWAVRGLVVGGIGGGRTERVYSDAARQIRQGQATSVREVLGLVANVVPSDEEFRLAMEGASVPRNYLARYYWLAFERFQSGEVGPAFVPVSDEKEVGLVRVVPRNSTPEAWPRFAATELSAYVNRLGNALILERTLLRDTTGSGLEAVSDIVGQSRFDSSRRLGGEVVWTPELIAERQRTLAAAAPEIWPRMPD